MSNRYYFQQANASNPLRSYQITQDSLPCIIKATSVPSYSASANLKAVDLAGGIIFATGSPTLTFATGSQLLAELLPSNLLYTGTSIVGNPIFGISPSSSQSLPLGATWGPCEVVNGVGSSLTFAAGDSSFDISLLQPATMAAATTRGLNFRLNSISPLSIQVYS